MSYDLHMNKNFYVIESINREQLTCHLKGFGCQPYSQAPRIWPALYNLYIYSRMFVRLFVRLFCFRPRNTNKPHVLNVT